MFNLMLSQPKTCLLDIPITSMLAGKLLILLEYLTILLIRETLLKCKHRMQAITALAHLNAAILFLLDISETCEHTCGYTIFYLTTD